MWEKSDLCVISVICNQETLLNIEVRWRRMFTLERTLEEIDRQRIILVAPNKAWSGTHLTPPMQEALHRHKKDLAQLMQDGAIAVCPSKDLHRASWRYNGAGRFTCELCQRFVSVGIC